MLPLSPARERRLLQTVVAILALVPVLAGLAGVVCGLSVFDVHAGVSRSGDSQVRYLSGLLVAIGFSRLYAVVRIGFPAAGMLVGLVLELLVTPVLAIWREALERKLYEPDQAAKTDGETVSPRP